MDNMYLEISIYTVALIILDYIMEYIGVKFKLSGKKQIDMSLIAFVKIIVSSFILAIFLYLLEPYI